jgi:hypothetical protein
MALYSQSTVLLKDKDGNPITVPLVSGGGITTGTAPLHADLGIGSISDPIATAWTGDLSLISMQKALLKKQIEPRTDYLIRQMWSGGTSAGAASVIYSDGGAYALTQSPSAIQPIRLVSISGMVVPTITTGPPDYFGNTTTTITPAVDGYILIVGSRSGAVGPSAGTALMNAVLQGSAATLEILTTPIYLPGGHAGSSNTSSISSFGTIPANISAFGGRSISWSFPGGLRVPGGCIVVVSTQPDAYVAHPRAYAQVVYEII